MLFYHPSCEQHPNYRRQCGKDKSKLLSPFFSQFPLLHRFSFLQQFSFPNSTPVSAAFGIGGRISSIPWGKWQWSVVHANFVSLYANIRKLLNIKGTHRECWQGLACLSLFQVKATKGYGAVLFQRFVRASHSRSTSCPTLHLRLTHMK